MSIRTRVLWGLGVHGPCANAYLAGQLRLHRLQVYGATWELRQQGLAALGKGGYRLTERGIVSYRALEHDRRAAGIQLTLWESSR